MRSMASGLAVILLAAGSVAGCNQLLGIEEGVPASCASASDCPSPGACAIATCIDGACQSGPAEDGTPCGTGDACASPATCSAGACVPGEPTDCSFHDGDCTVGLCDPQLGCTQAPANEGFACDDGLFCTVDDVCTAGACGGQPNICGAPADVCLIGSCDEDADACTTVPGPDDVSCTDGDACTGGDSCQGGACVGLPIASCVGGDGCCPSGCPWTQDADCLPLPSPSYDPTQTFLDALAADQITMTLAWDGTSLWSSSGGTATGTRLARYSPAGELTGTFQPGIDFRSIFTKGDGTTPVYARAYQSGRIRVQTSPGSFADDVLLPHVTLGDNSAVVYDAEASQFVAFYAGAVSRFSDSGALVGVVDLIGFGTMNDENVFPQNRGIICRGGWYLTYSSGVLSAWDASGQRANTTVLNGAGTSVSSYFSLSHAAGRVWIVDQSAGTWRGYDVGL